MHINLAVISGVMTNEPVCRELTDGATVAQFDVSTTVDRDGRPASVSVPVSWRNPTDAALSALVPGDDVVVVGRIERRFFRTGGSTQSRTELVAERCLPTRRKKSVRSLLVTAARTLTI
jgi:single-strand DNA-binding protein